MDIKQTALASAALTLGKDMVLRDYAQGAWRMRGLGSGQVLQVRTTLLSCYSLSLLPLLLILTPLSVLQILLVPEVERLVRECAAAAGGSEVEAPPEGRAMTPRDALAWLTVRTAHADLHITLPLPRDTPTTTNTGWHASSP